MCKAISSFLDMGRVEAYDCCVERLLTKPEEPV